MRMDALGVFRLLRRGLGVWSVWTDTPSLVSKVSKNDLSRTKIKCRSGQPTSGQDDMYRSALINRAVSEYILRVVSSKWRSSCPWPCACTGVDGVGRGRSCVLLVFGRLYSWNARRSPFLRPSKLKRGRREKNRTNDDEPPPPAALLLGPGGAKNGGKK